MKKIKNLKCKGCQMSINPETDLNIGFDFAGKEANGIFIISCPKCNNVLYKGDINKK